MRRLRALLRRAAPSDGRAYPGTGWELPGDAEGRVEAARWAYRILLLRDPESRHAAEGLAAAGSARAMRDVLLRSAELRAQQGYPVQTAMTGNEPPQEVELEVSAEERAQLFAMVHRVWQRLGTERPHWSVLSTDEYAPERIAGRMEEFYRTGEIHIDMVLRTLERNGVAPPRAGLCIDYGCGVGRLTAALSRVCRDVVGVDVSAPHLELARQALAERKVANASLRQLRAVDEIDALPVADLVVSLIVLQHNPPPVMREILSRLLGRLAPGGAAVIQLPTYMPGSYKFRVREYLAQGGKDMEMHPLPQREVMAVARAAGVEVLEVLEDGWSAFGYGGRSNTFVMRRPG